MTVRTILLGIALAAAISAAALASGCGSGEADEPATVTKPEYLKRANAACREERSGLDERVVEFLEISGGNGKPREVLIADLAHNVLLPTVENEMEAVRALRPPKGETGRIDRLLYLEESDLTRIVFMQRVKSIAAVKREFAESARLLTDYGLPACANGPQTLRDAA